MKSLIPFLQHGATIGITCPSGHMPMERITPAISLLKQAGYHVKLGETVGSAFHYFAATDAIRKKDLQNMLNDPEIHAILMGRGGYGLSRIIDDIDFSGFLKYPKWVCGFSDITLLHQQIQCICHLPSLHSPMCGAIHEESWHTPHIQSLFQTLHGESIEYRIKASSYNRLGSAQGILTGGNLAMLAHLTGTPSAFSTEGKILFIEDVGEYLYNIDRMLIQLKRAGWFDNLAGLIIGGFTELKDTERPFGQAVEEIIADKIREYTYPVCFQFPAGHQEENYTLMLGATHRLDITLVGSTLQRVNNDPL